MNDTNNKKFNPSLVSFHKGAWRWDFLNTWWLLHSEAEQCCFLHLQ